MKKSELIKRFTACKHRNGYCIEYTNYKHVWKMITNDAFTWDEITDKENLTYKRLEDYRSFIIFTGRKELFIKN